MIGRVTYTGRSVTAGCYTCGDKENGDPLMARWHGPNSQGVAARHHDATGHRTWVDVYMTVTYGEKPDASADGKDKS